MYCIILTESGQWLIFGRDGECGTGRVKKYAWNYFKLLLNGSMMQRVVLLPYGSRGLTSILTAEAVSVEFARICCVSFVWSGFLPRLSDAVKVN